MTASKASLLKSMFALHSLLQLPTKRKGEVEIFTFDQNSVELEQSPDSLAPGKLSFFFEDQVGHFLLSEHFTLLPNSRVKRTIDRVIRQPKLAQKNRGWVSGWMGDQPSDFNLSASEVVLESDSLQLPAWIVAGSNHWVIHVHGRTAKRAECLRNFRVFTNLGYTNMAISLRNNGEGSDFANRNSHLGELEWRDLEASVEYAIRKGARSITLFGISQGSVAVAEFLRRSSGQALVSSVILDSPVVDWKAAIEFAVENAGLKLAVADRAIRLLRSKLATKVLGLKTTIDVGNLGFSNWSEKFEIPILVLHSSDDGYVPYEPVRKLVAEHANIEFESYTDLRHVKLYNGDPERYENRVTQFMNAHTK